MSSLELIGFFWVVLMTGLGSAVVMIAASVALYCGWQTLYFRYKRGEREERLEREVQRSLEKATS